MQTGDVQTQAGFRERPPKRAGFIERLLAAVLDIALVNLAIKAVNMAMTAVWADKYAGHFAVVYLMPLLLTLAYFAVFAWLRQGQTMAKGWLRLRIVDLQGRRVKLPRMLLREFLARGIVILAYGLVGAYSLLWYLTYLFALGKRKRALHDLLARTQVIIVRKQRSRLPQEQF